MCAGMMVGNKERNERVADSDTRTDGRSNQAHVAESVHGDVLNTPRVLADRATDTEDIRQYQADSGRHLRPEQRQI